MRDKKGNGCSMAKDRVMIVGSGGGLPGTRVEYKSNARREDPRLLERIRWLRDVLTDVGEEHPPPASTGYIGFYPVLLPDMLVSHVVRHGSVDATYRLELVAISGDQPENEADPMQPGISAHIVRTLWPALHSVFDKTLYRSPRGRAWYWDWPPHLAIAQEMREAAEGHKRGP